MCFALVISGVWKEVSGGRGWKLFSTQLTVSGLWLDAEEETIASDD